MLYVEIHYTREQFGKAVRALATGLGDLRERLLNAMRAGVMHASNNGAGVPAELQERINDLTERLTAVDGPEGSLKATIDTLSDEELQDAAREICDLDYLLDGVGK